jgi:hypothetical protein
MTWPPDVSEGDKSQMRVNDGGCSKVNRGMFADEQTLPQPLFVMLGEKQKDCRTSQYGSLIPKAPLQVWRTFYIYQGDNS